MRARLIKMRWIAVLLVVCILFTLVGCHATLRTLVASILGLWLSGLPVALIDTGGALELALLGLALEFLTYSSMTGADTAVAGNTCDLFANVDMDGDGIGDQSLNLHGPWQQNGDRVTATLTPTGVTAAQIGAPTITLDLRLTGENTMAGTLSYMLGAQLYEGQVALERAH